MGLGLGVCWLGFGLWAGGFLAAMLCNALKVTEGLWRELLKDHGGICKILF